MVRAGDVLGTIAQRELGSAKKWPVIADLNPKIDPKRLLVGSRLKLPAATRSTRTRGQIVAKADSSPVAEDNRNRVR